MRRPDYAQAKIRCTAWRSYFQLADPAGWESTLDLEHEPEHLFERKLIEETQMINSFGDGRKTFHASDVGGSRFFSREDVGDGLIGTISAMTLENVSPADPPENPNWCVHFKEHSKMLVLNKTRKNQIVQIAGGQSEEEWINARIEMYDDPSVEFAGKRTGGIRVRKPAEASVPAPAGYADDIDF